MLLLVFATAGLKTWRTGYAQESRGVTPGRRRRRLSWRLGEPQKFPTLPAIHFSFLAYIWYNLQ